MIFCVTQYEKGAKADCCVPSARDDRKLHDSSDALHVTFERDHTSAGHHINLVQIESNAKVTLCGSLDAAAQGDDR